MDFLLSTEDFRTLETIITTLSSHKGKENKVMKIKTYREVIKDIDSPMTDKQVARRKLREYIVFYKYNGISVMS